MKKPYVSRLGEISGFKIMIVDGKYIRDNMDIGFTNFGQHLRYAYIPKDEFWIDYEYGRTREEKFYIDHMFIERRLMEKGLRYNDALTIADDIEVHERNEYMKHEKKFRWYRNNKSFIDALKIKKLRKYSGKISVWIVDGKIVRDIFFIDFTLGGHDKVYAFIPKNEIWIDDDVNPEEIPFILVHEMHERTLMAKGWGYDPILQKGQKIMSISDRSAHKSAHIVERNCRKNPLIVNQRLMREVEMSNALIEK